MRSHRWQIEHHASVRSTQDTLAAALELQPSAHLCCCAEIQTGGRGRRGRDWESPPGGLWCSLNLQISTQVDPCWTLILAEAARSSLEQFGATGLVLKWPNDLMVGHRKWGGIVAEVRSFGSQAHVILGLGLNLRISAADLPPPQGGRPAPTSIQAEFGSSPSPASALTAILSRFEGLLAADGSTGRGATVATLSRSLSTLGKTIRWSDPQGNFVEGIARSLRQDGALEVEDAKGATVPIVAGDIHHVRHLP